MQTWKKKAAALCAVIFACAAFAGCGGSSDGDGMVNTDKQAQGPVAISEQKITADPVATYSFGDKEAKIYEYKTEAEIPNVSMLFATQNEIYVVNSQSDERHIYMYTPDGDQLKDGQEIFTTKAGLQTDDKYLYVREKSAFVWDGKEKKEVTMPNGYFVLTPDGKTAYKDGGFGTVTRYSYTDFQLQDETEVLKDFDKTLKTNDETVKKLLSADNDGFYLEVTAKNGTQNGSNWSQKVYAFDTNGQRTKVYDNTVGVTDEKNKYTNFGDPVITKDYVVFRLASGFRIYNKADASYVGEFSTDMKTIQISNVGVAYLGGNSILFSNFTNYGKKPLKLYRMDL